MNGRCLEQCIIYKATVQSTEGERYYIGVSEQEFKKRYYNHKSSFENSKNKSATTLSKYIWNIKDRRTPSTIKWNILKKCSPYKCGTRRCELCITEKFFILMYNSDKCLNRNSELLQKCRHNNKYKFGKLTEEQRPPITQTCIYYGLN